MACNIIIGTVPLHESVAERLAPTNQPAVPSAPVCAITEQPSRGGDGDVADTVNKQDGVSLSEVPISIRKHRCVDGYDF